VVIAISTIPINDTNVEQPSFLDHSFYELAAFHDLLSQANGGVRMTDVDLKDLYIWLRNPNKFRKQLIQLSKYYYVKDGIVTDVLDIFKSLPIISPSTFYNNMEHRSYKNIKKKVDTFINNIKVKKLARDTIFSVMQEGFCVWYNRGNKYIQFLEYDQIDIQTMRNGKWEVLYNLQYLDQFKGEELKQQINAAPDEVTMAAYNAYKKDKTKQYVKLDINKTQVFKIRGARNEPFGFPYCIPALASIIHRDLLEKSEKSLAERVINQILIQKIGTMPSQDGKSQLPVPKEQADTYHRNLKNLVQKKHEGNATDNTSTGVLSIPSIITIEELKVNMNTFPKEVWERIERDIYKKLGYSMSLNMGGGNGQSYGSSTINVEKIYSIIFSVLEDIEDALNEYLDLITGEIVKARIWLGRSTILDRETSFKQAESLYTKGRGSLKHMVEAAGYSFDHWLQQVIFENEVLRLNERLPVHQTSYTASGNDKGGRPEDKNSKNDNTDFSRGSGGNNTPSPSD